MVDLLDTVNESIDRLQNAVRGAAAAGFDGGLVNAWVNSFEAHRIDRFEARVGFIGRTGEGKSQAINAILGQRNVFPTSGFNACTATVIEASYQAEKDYKAEIEFITRVSSHSACFCFACPSFKLGNG